MSAHYTVTNWRKFQHYKDRNPPWIKLHFEMLSSADWVMLDDTSRVLAIACMLIASRNEGTVPANPDYIKRVAYLNKTPNFKPLIDSGFLQVASGCKRLQADVRPETETETETEKETETYGLKVPFKCEVKGQFEEFWKEYPRKIGKPKAKSAYLKAIKTAEHADIMDGLQKHVSSDGWTKDGGQFIPHPTTWLNREGWNDQVLKIVPAIRNNFTRCESPAPDLAKEERERDEARKRFEENVRLGREQC